MAWIAFAVLAACESVQPEHAARAVAFEDLFEPVDSVALEEPEGDPANLIVGVTAIAPAPDGRIAVVDRKSARVRIYSGTDGHLLASVGRYGRGPGEFAGPNDAAFDRAGRLYVVDVDNPRMTRFDSELRLDTIFSVPGYFAYEVHAAGDDALLLVTTRATEEWLALTSLDAEPRAFFHPLDSAAMAVPYWGSILTARAAVSADGIYVLTNLVYPLHRYSLEGQPRGTFGSPPASWIEPVRPQYGQFINQAIAEISEWLRSFTVADAVGVYRDSLILVAHGRYERFQGEVIHYALDVYDLEGRKLYEHVPVPGRFLHAGDHVYFLVASPPAPWTIARYSMRPASSR